MKLFVCWGTFRHNEHPCGKAHAALRAAGHEPEVVRTFGCYRTDPIFPGRRQVRRMTGSYQVPVLVLDDGTLVEDSANIVAWAEANPA